MSQAVVTAIGLDDTGHKRFLGVDCVDTESRAGWRAFLSDLRARGVEGVRLVVSDAHEGLRAAAAETFQGAAWQRCVTHLMRNVAGRICKREDQRRAREAMKAVFAQKSPILVRACYQQATEEILKLSKGAGEALLEAEESALAYLAFPASHRIRIRTNKRPGEGQPRDQAPRQRRAGVPLARVADTPGGRGADRGRRGVVGALRHLQALARPRLEGARAPRPDGGGGARRPGGGPQDHRKRD